jgi:hypothetical protein
MSEDRCDHEMLPGQCGHSRCRNSPQRAGLKTRTPDEEAAEIRQAMSGMPGWILAQYPGQCIGCGERFAVGDPITLVRDRTGTRWQATCCATDQEIAEARTLRRFR